MLFVSSQTVCAAGASRGRQAASRVRWRRLNACLGAEDRTLPSMLRRCGSSREHAPVALGASGASVVVAESYARIFFRNCVST